MPGLMRGGWKRGPVSGPPSLQRAAWTAPDHPATAPASYSTTRLLASYQASDQGGRGAVLVHAAGDLPALSLPVQAALPAPSPGAATARDAAWSGAPRRPG